MAPATKRLCDTGSPGLQGPNRVNSGRQPSRLKGASRGAPSGDEHRSPYQSKRKYRTTNRETLGVSQAARTRPGLAHWATGHSKAFGDGSQSLGIQPSRTMAVFPWLPKPVRSRPALRESSREALSRGFGGACRKRDQPGCSWRHHSQPPVHSIKRGRGGYAGWRAGTGPRSGRSPEAASRHFHRRPPAH